MTALASLVETTNIRSTRSWQSILDTDQPVTENHRITLHSLHVPLTLHPRPLTLIGELGWRQHHSRAASLGALMQLTKLDHWWDSHRRPRAGWRTLTQLPAPHYQLVPEPVFSLTHKALPTWAMWSNNAGLSMC